MCSYDAEAVANTFLEKAEAAGRPLTTMQLQKLLYFAHGWNLAFHGQPLLTQRLQAWRYGPVVPSIYHEFKRFGANPLQGARAMKKEGHTFRGVWEDDLDVATLPGPDQDRCFEQTRRLLDEVQEVYGGLSGPQLSAMSHVSGGPWARTYFRSPNRARYNCSINDDEIRTYFQSLKEKGRAF